LAERFRTEIKRTEDELDDKRRKLKIALEALNLLEQEGGGILLQDHLQIPLPVEGRKIILTRGESTGSAGK
jgi:hypothetical protein